MPPKRRASRWRCANRCRRGASSTCNGGALKTHLTPRDLALTLFVVAVLGFSFVPMKVGLREIPPFMMASLRFLFAALPMVFFVKRPRMPWRFVVGYGLAIGVGQFGSLFLALSLGMPVGLSSLVIQVQIFFTIGLGIAFLGDQVHRHNLAGAIIAAAGLALLGVFKLTSGATGTFLGFVLVLLAAFCWGIGNTIAKRAARAHDSDMLALVVWSSLVPPLPLFALACAIEGGPAVIHAVVNADALTWGCVLFLAWGATLFGFASWARLMHRYPTALIAPFALLIPVSGLASGVLLLGETLAPMQMLGVALVFAGLAENTYGAQLRAWLARLRQ
jgi:O-acetylserine/cysteine efflux transporter